MTDRERVELERKIEDLEWCLKCDDDLIDRLDAENKRLRAVETAARDVLDAYDQRDDDMDWTVPAVDMILRRALTEGRHYAV